MKVPWRSSKRKLWRFLNPRRNIAYQQPFMLRAKVSDIPQAFGCTSSDAAFYIQRFRVRVLDDGKQVAYYKKRNKAYINNEYMKYCSFWKWQYAGSVGRLRIIKDTALYKDRVARFSKYRIDMRKVGTLLYSFLVENCPRTANYREAEYSRRNLRNETVHHIWQHYWEHILKVMVASNVIVRLTPRWTMRIVQGVYPEGIAPLVRFEHSSDSKSIYGGFDLHLAGALTSTESRKDEKTVYTIRKLWKRQLRQKDILPHPYYTIPL